MKNFTYLCVLPILALTVLITGSAFADPPIACPPDIFNQTITEKVIANSGCDIERSTILGKVKVQPEASVEIEDSDTSGNITILEDGRLILEGGTLSGNVECPDGGLVIVCGTNVTGNIDESCTQIPCF